MATSLGAVLSPTYAAWNPTHGHIGSAAAIAHHTHPWDTGTSSTLAAPSLNLDDYCYLHGAPHPISPAGDAATNPPSAEGKSLLVFTMSADGTVAGVSASALPATVPSAQLRPMLSSPIDGANRLPPRSAAQAVPVPPPRA